MAYEKMRCLYDTERDLIDRLHNTICRYQDKAVLVSVMGKNQISLHSPVSQDKIVEIRPSDPDFDISSPEIGYVNYTRKDGRKEVYYLERNPYRKFRQGLYAECCSLYEIDGSLSTRDSPGILFRESGLIECIENRYPSFKEAYVGIRTGSMAPVAVSRDVALEPKKTGLIVVYCQGNDVGYICHDEHSIKFKRDDTAWVIDAMLGRAGIRMREYG